MRPKPLIATPCYGGLLCVNYVTSVLRLRQACAQVDMPVEFYFRQDSLITRARNDCVAHFLAGGCSHLFFVDADIGFEPEAALRLLMSGHDVVAGVYPIKHDDAGFPVDMAAIGPADAHGFAEAEQAPTGFMCIARRALEQVPFPFDELRLDGGHLSEDYAFCHRWRAVGGKVHIDVESRLTHQGSKLYVRDFRKELEKLQ